jgi:hypothetical protein
MKPISTNRLLLTAVTLASAACQAPPIADPTVTPEPARSSSAPRVSEATAEPRPAPVPAPRPIAPVPLVVGMLEPFGRINSTALARLDEGGKALRKKQYPEARAAFHDVVAAYPDKPGARYQELRATALAGDFAAVPALWRELLARDFPGYANRLDQGKEMAPLRRSQAWAEMVAVRDEVRRAYTSGLERGFLFVARTRSYAAPSFEDDSATAKVELDQEAYHFDPASQRIRRLSETGGQVAAIHRDDRHGPLMLLMARTLEKVAEGTAFKRPEAALLSLETLERVGPITIDASAVSLDLCFSRKGEPVWTVNTAGAAEGRALTLDTTGSALVPLEETCGPSVATTLVMPTGVEHERPDPEGVALSDDGLQLTGVDADKPVRSSQVIRAGSFSWSPGKKRFAYTGDVGRCDLVAQLDQKQKPTANAVVVWDAQRRTAARVTSAVTLYETAWIDDDHMVYESGLDRGAKLTIHDFSPGGTALVVKAPAGAALFGLSALPCPRSETQALAR